MTAVAAHCAYSAFIFVPNVCNARCAFCYVRPAYSNSANASEVVINRAKLAAEALTALGFRSVRFTGGEPTLFANFSEIVHPFLERGLTYRVLTNGINLDNCIDFFSLHPPERFTISVHTAMRPGEIFGVPISTQVLAENRRMLAQIAAVEATIVLEDAGECWGELNETLAALEREGVLYIKLILENSLQFREAVSFSGLVHRVSKIWGDRFRSLRFTDPRQHSCKLSTKGFPAIDLGRGVTYACCVQVGDRPVVQGYAEDLPATAAEAIESIARLVGHSVIAEPPSLPCAAGTLFCPLALRP